jgi:hypothetical protein
LRMPLHALRGQHWRIGKPQGAPKVSIARIIDTVFAKTSPKRSFSMTENEYFGLVFTKTGSGSINSGTGADAGYHSRKQAMNESVSLGCAVRIRFRSRRGTMRVFHILLRT